MASGISKAKGRRNSKSQRRAGFQAYPAKAGRRKQYGEGSKRKVKSFPDGTQGFIMRERDPREYREMERWVINPKHTKTSPAYVLRSTTQL